MKITPSGWGLILFFLILTLQLYTDIPIFPIFIGLIFLLIFSVIFIDKFNINIGFAPKLSKEQAESVKTKFKINKKIWNRKSRNQKYKLYLYAIEQDRIITRIINNRDSYPKLYYGNNEYWLNYAEKRKYIKTDVENEWSKFTLKERILSIERHMIKFEEEDYKKYEDRLRIKKHRELTNEKRKKREEKERKIKEEQDLLIKQKEQAKRNKIEKEKKIEREKIDREKRKIIEEESRIKLITERKKQEKERYKEYYKRRQREKEKRRQWESEATQERIDSGEINGNNSSDRKRTIPSDVKEIVYTRDKGCCVTCGSRVDIEYDHIIPFSKGGSNSINNIQLLCLKCNRRKSNKIM